MGMHIYIKGTLQLSVTLIEKICSEIFVALFNTIMKITIVLLTVIVLLASKGLEANYSENSVDADFDAGFRNGSISTFLSRFTCGSGSTCDGMDNAYTATRGVGCSTQCEWVYCCHSKW